MHREIEVRVRSGWLMLFLNIVVYVAAIALVVGAVHSIAKTNELSRQALWMLVAEPFVVLAGVLMSIGFFILQPNVAGVLLLFGKYVGTVKSEGFWWANPFYTKKKISLRVRNLNSEKIKVNDHAGNPIEIAAIVVWKVEDAFAACFEVDDYGSYVTIQSESAIRHLASAYAYDSWEEGHAVSLRGNIDEVSKALEKELQERLEKAGVKILEARLSHLAYAPEIAEAMLRRQQAGAVVAARRIIVENAVGMVRMALEHLRADNVVDLDEERKATMVSNLLVVLCSEHHAQPVVNAGTLYS